MCEVQFVDCFDVDCVVDHVCWCVVLGGCVDVYVDVVFGVCLGEYVVLEYFYLCWVYCLEYVCGVFVFDVL